MKILSVLIKLVLSTLVCVYLFQGDTVIHQIVLFALAYGLITYYIFYIKEWIEDGGEEGMIDEGIIRIFKPDFLNTDTETESGYIEKAGEFR